MKSWQGDTEDYVNSAKGHFFTPEQLNEYTAKVIRQSLETAAENARMTLLVDEENDIIEEANIDKQSITNTFEQTFKQFEV